MSLSRANIESILIRRCGRMLTACGLDGTTINGSNADLNDPIAWAIKQLGGSVAARTSVADSDIATVAAEDEEALLDLAELRTLESALTNLDATDIRVGDREEKLDQLSKRLESTIARKRSQIQRDHGLGLGTLSAGVLTLGFQQHNNESSDE